MEVKVYSAPWCVWCNRTKALLKEHKIKFEDINVDEDYEAMHEMVYKSGQTGIPVIDIDGKIVIGFDEEALVHLLKIPRKN